jgi:MoxR-like ATPase
MTPLELLAAQAAVQDVHASDALLDYLQAVIQATRSGTWFAEGLSPRAGIAVLRAARARALLGGRDYVAPDDVQYVLPQTDRAPARAGGRRRARAGRAGAGHDRGRAAAVIRVLPDRL